LRKSSKMHFWMLVQERNLLSQKSWAERIGEA